MRVILITYELNGKPEDNYAAFYETIKDAKHWWHYLKNSWLIATEKDPKYWGDRLEEYICKGDRFFVVEVTKEYWGRLPSKAWEWIAKHLGPTSL